MRRIIIVVAGLIGITLYMLSCKKADTAANKDIDLSRPYCNDPQAVNYNWGFPGTPDSNVCFFPFSVFEGDYTLIDSVFDANYNLDSAQTILRTLHIYKIDRTHLAIIGFCGANDTLKATATRFYSAYLDSTPISTTDTVKLKGQVLTWTCNYNDTITGGLTRPSSDSTHLHINFTLATDTGIFYHISTGTKN